MKRPIRVAVIHEWLVDYSGSERVLEQILEIFPEAELFAVVDFLPRELRSIILNKSVTTTFVQNFPWAKQYYRHYLPFMPIAIEQLDMTGFDLVISSCHAVAKGILTGPDQVHIAYVHSPMRYAWDLQHQYLKASDLDRGIKSALMRFLLHYMRIWDNRSAVGVDYFLANSQFIARRIHKAYRRNSQVIYPPVAIANFPIIDRPREDFYLTVSRLVPYKKVDLIVETFQQLPDRHLIIIGDGPERAKIQSLASNNIKWLGFQPQEIVRDYMQRARAFVFAAEEDFGITPLEAQSCGTPVIGFGKGGLQETIVPTTGILYFEQTVASLRDAIQQFEKNSFAPQACHHNAQRFAPDRFRCEFLAAVETFWQNYWQS